MADKAARGKPPPLHCWLAMEKLMSCATKFIKGSGATPGFCSQNLEVRVWFFSLTKTENVLNPVL
jgi:hypothetical protein